MVSFRDSPEEAAFRQEVRQFIEERVPSELKGQTRFGERGGPAFEAAQERWKAALKERGWHAAHWPREYGGAGLSTIEQFIFKEEMARQRIVMPFSVAISHAGPTIMLHGNEEQKREFLPKILAGEHSWCQGFSEPGAGSDLASLQTRAVLDGDDYVINGQKIWTSYAHESDWMILLARTDPDAPKHKGISYFLVDLQTPGLTVRPLINMGGQTGFNEVFFDNVRVPKENLVGEENRGWYIGTATLDFERSGIATGVSHSLTVNELVAFQKERSNGHNDTLIRYELADRAIESQVELMLNHKVIGVQARGMVPSNEATVAKLYSSELDQRIANTGLKLMGPYAQLTSGSKYADRAMDGRFSSTYMYATTSTIGGGTSEVQRNIIAQRGLGLPRV